MKSLRDCRRDDVEQVGEFVARQFADKEPVASFQIGNKTMPQDTLRRFVLSFIHEGDVPDLSLMIRNDRKLVAAALNETLAPTGLEPPLVVPGMERILTLLVRQDEQALTFCCAHIKGFADAWKRSKVGHHFMIAGSGAGAAEAAFTGSMKTFQRWGHEFVVRAAIGFLIQTNLSIAVAVHTLYFWNDTLTDLREIHRGTWVGGPFLLAFGPKEDEGAVSGFPESVYRFVPARRCGI